VLDLDVHACELRSDLRGDHNDLGPRSQQLADLPGRHRPTPDYHATPAGEVQKYGVKNGVFALDLCSCPSEWPVD
jgi:hypothetical protein